MPSQQPDFAKEIGWCMAYPAYINQKLSLAKGRRVPITKCCEHPRAEELAEVCRFLELPAYLEMYKLYSRDPLFHNPGRVRYRLKNDDGVFYHADIKTSK